MAWTNPTTQSTGTLITATIWNTDIVDNLTALRSGSVALTSQAAGDVIYASSSTQLGRVAIGSSGYVLTSNGSAPAWSNTPTLTGTNFTGIPAASILAGTFGSGNYTIPGNVRLIASTSDYIEVSNSSNTEKAVYVSSYANGTAATAAFRVQNVAYTGWLTLPTATFTTAGLREANVLALVGDAPTLRLGTSHGSGVVQFYSGNTLALTLGASQAASFTGDVSLASTKKLYLDGGGDSYIAETAANVVRIYAGGVDAVIVKSDGLHLGAVATTASAANMYYNTSTARVEYSTSSLRYKHDIDTLDADHALSAVMAMRPVTYRGKTDDDQRRYVGFIAEEVMEIAPLLATYDEGGETGTPNYVTYDRVTAYLVAVVQKQQAEINALKARIQ